MNAINTIWFDLKSGQLSAISDQQSAVSLHKKTTNTKQMQTINGAVNSDYNMCKILAE
jgi:hypothetical protein